MQYQEQEYKNLNLQSRLWFLAPSMPAKTTYVLNSLCIPDRFNLSMCGIELKVPQADVTPCFLLSHVILPSANSTRVWVFITSPPPHTPQQRLNNLSCFHVVQSSILSLSRLSPCPFFCSASNTYHSLIIGIGIIPVPISDAYTLVFPNLSYKLQNDSVISLLTSFQWVFLVLNIKSNSIAF